MAAIALSYLTEGANAVPWVTLLVLGSIIVGFWLFWRRLARPKTATAKDLSARLDVVTSMGGSSSGAHFEILVADLLRAMGHEARVPGGSGDQSVDVIVGYQGERVAVQCKNYKRRVGNKPIQEVYAGARHHNCKKAWVVAPAGYTKGAEDLARSTGAMLFEEGPKEHVRAMFEFTDFDLDEVHGFIDSREAAAFLGLPYASFKENRRFAAASAVRVPQARALGPLPGRLGYR